MPTITMTKKAALALSVLLAFQAAHADDAGTLGSPGVVDPKSPQGVVQTIIKGASALDDSAHRAENAKRIESLVDFHRLTRDALGDNAAEASPAQLRDVETLLKSIITRTVYPEAPKFFRDVHIDYKQDSGGAQDGTGAGQAHITSTVTKGSKHPKVEYWLVAEGDSYRVIDFSIEGERWVENVRDQFDEVIRKKGFNGLIERMKKRVSELKPTGV